VEIGRHFVPVNVIGPINRNKALCEQNFVCDTERRISFVWPNNRSRRARGSVKKVPMCVWLFFHSDVDVIILLIYTRLSKQLRLTKVTVSLLFFARLRDGDNCAPCSK
jgi:hypothetical protein